MIKINDKYYTKMNITSRKFCQTRIVLFEGTIPSVETEPPAKIETARSPYKKPRTRRGFLIGG